MIDRLLTDPVSVTVVDGFGRSLVKYTPEFVSIGRIACHAEPGDFEIECMLRGDNVGILSYADVRREAELVFCLEGRPGGDRLRCHIVHARVVYEPQIPPIWSMFEDGRSATRQPYEDVRIQVATRLDLRVRVIDWVPVPPPVIRVPMIERIRRLRIRC